MARVGDGPSFRRPPSAAAAVLEADDELRERAGGAKAKKPPAARKRNGAGNKGGAKGKGKAGGGQGDRNSGGASTAPRGGTGFDVDLVPLPVMVRPSVWHAIERLAREAGGPSRSAIARAALERIPNGETAIVEWARGESATARAAGEGGRGLEHQVRVYAHQRRALSEAAAVLEARGVVGAQSLLANACLRQAVDSGADGIRAVIAELEGQREDALFAAAAQAAA